jgi:sugar O-acyltransferase (sialic acid O-acetyltransferase NeuD family)
VCVDVVECEARFSIVGLVGLPHEVGTRILGYPVLGTDEDLSGLLTPYPNVIVTAGQIKTPDLRIRLFDMLHRSGRTLPTIVSPRAYVSPHATVGAGSIVMHGAVVNAGAAIGRNCIINSQALVEHDAVIGDHCHISTAAVINGGVQVGPGTFVGSNSSVRESAAIGARCVIGMGQRVLADCSDGTWLPAKGSRS